MKIRASGSESWPGTVSCISGSVDKKAFSDNLFSGLYHSHVKPIFYKSIHIYKINIVCNYCIIVPHGFFGIDEKIFFKWAFSNSQKIVKGHNHFPGEFLKLIPRWNNEKSHAFGQRVPITQIFTSAPVLTTNSTAHLLIIKHLSSRFSTNNGEPHQNM